MGMLNFVKKVKIGTGIKVRKQWHSPYKMFVSDSVLIGYKLVTA